jgi:hypothetical protein
MSVGFVGGGEEPEDEPVQLVRCPSCRNSESVRVRTSTTQRLEGGRPIVTLECACGHVWKIIGTAPVRVLVVRLQQTASQSRTR